MGAIPLPERGQPLDLNYLYEVVNQLNNITNTVTSKSNAISRINSQSLTTSNLVIFGDSKPFSADNVAINSNTTVTFNFNQPFKFPPVIVCSIENRLNNSIGQNVVSTVTQVNNSGATVNLRFGTAGVVGLVVNIIAIGIPN
jgi:hypothetical protein